MLHGLEIIKPEDIEKRSFEMITEILGDRSFPAMHGPIIKRVIHTTADFEYADMLKISPEAIEAGIEALRGGCNIITDTKMAAAGINKKALAKLGGQVVCFMDHEEVAVEAKNRNTTRASVCMERAVQDDSNKIFVIGNAPTALIRLFELIKEGLVCPKLVIGVPVGFVNVLESKALIKTSGVPYIISESRKGGSNVAAAITNALLYMID